MTNQGQIDKSGRMWKVKKRPICLRDIKNKEGKNVEEKEEAEGERRKKEKEEEEEEENAYFFSHRKQHISRVNRGQKRERERE